MAAIRPSFGYAAMGIGLTVTAVVAGSFWAERHVPAGLLPHGVCFTWLPSLVWLHVISDALIGLAYLTIPIGLVVLVRRRKDLPLHWMFLLFGLFIVSCGLTHLLGIWTIWQPDYWVAGGVKAVTAAASVLTAVVMIPAIPKALQIPTAAQLRAANEQLQAEVEMRKQAEAALREIQLDLERRVAERTVELEQARATAELLRARADEANQMKDTFLAKVSHELRTPLQATLSWSTLLTMQSGANEIAAQAAERIAANTRTQAKLIDDLLDVSRILSGKLKLDLRGVKVGDIVRRAHDVVAPIADKGQIKVVLHTPCDDVDIITDPDRLAQVVWNLATNAIHASKPADEVVIASTCSEDTLRVTVTDTGVGIPAEDLRVIFEPFRQGSTDAVKHRGLGLGLAISYSIVALLGGRIYAKSDGPGRGATFVVEVPLNSGAPSKVADEQLTSEQWARARQLHVLYVEDDVDIADAVAATLRPHVASVTVAHSADAALKSYDPSRHRVLLSDLNLGPGQDGYALLRTLRERGASLSRAVALSAFGGEVDRQRSAEAGFDAHLVKPASVGQLLAMIV